MAVNQVIAYIIYIPTIAQ